MGFSYSNRDRLDAAEPSTLSPVAKPGYPGSPLCLLDLNVSFMAYGGGSSSSKFTASSCFYVLMLSLYEASGPRMQRGGNKGKEEPLTSQNAARAPLMLQQQLLFSTA